MIPYLFFDRIPLEANITTKARKEAKKVPQSDQATIDLS
jgi:hypothetical protein